jgi:hypothetical protein
MFSVPVLLIGCGIATIGLLVMRDPMRLALLAPGAEGYYQRMVLDRYQRNQFRMLGMMVSCFGLVILTAALKGLLRFRILDSVSNGFLVLLWLLFIAAFSFGVIYSVVQLVRGRGKELFFGWFRMWRQGIELGPIAVHPAITPEMRRECIAFTAVYCLLIAVTVVAAFVAP